MNGHTNLMSGDKVRCVPTCIDATSGAQVYLIIPAEPQALFKVKLVEDTSPTPLTQSGDQANLPVFQYTIKTANNAYTLATAQTAEKPYQIKCTHYPVGWGYAYFDASGTICLAEDWYTFYQHPC